MKLEEMKNLDIRTVDPQSLVDRRKISINKDLPQKERLKQYVEQIKNPYCYLDGDVVVKVSFTDETVTLEERLQAYIRSL
ncbi:hypothetical protein CIAN88_20925 [[Clostridium] innocuum]|uniref:DUF6870 domain-containing protein n=1 Tax=Clostridium innocuum TaxID=1522 RepID=A0A099I0F5_CLOIN|nr:hypothetical protein [[Clostridium] innocuum]KGJ51429.1 hypothetical protein CIAN88_20925 [[Clostridium] innocuum]